MTINKKFESILEIVKDKLSCSAHNLDHIFRVYELCMKIARTEKNVDMDILIPSALLHDIARVEESKDSSGQTDHALLGSEVAEIILKKQNYNFEAIEKIKHCIRSHRFRSNREPQSIEAKILFDADKLDAIGAVGIARSFMLAGQYGQSLNSENTSEKDLDLNSADNGRLKDVSKHSPMIEYEVKFKKIPASLYTETAKKIGLKRIEYMQKYFERLDDEMNGNL